MFSNSSKQRIALGSRRPARGLTGLLRAPRGNSNLARWLQACRISRARSACNLFRLAIALFTDEETRCIMSIAGKKCFTILRRWKHERSRCGFGSRTLLLCISYFRLDRLPAGKHAEPGNGSVFCYRLQPWFLHFGCSAACYQEQRMRKSD